MIGQDKGRNLIRQNSVSDLHWEGCRYYLRSMLLLILFWRLLDAVGYAQGDVTTDPPATPKPDVVATRPVLESEAEPFDYEPYRVLIWMAATDKRANVEEISKELAQQLDREFFAVWNTTIELAPPTVTSEMRYDLKSLDYDRLIASDPVIALKKSHNDAVRIRTAVDVPQYVDQLFANKAVKARLDRLKDSGDVQESFASVHQTIGGIPEELPTLDSLWKLESTEAIYTTRGVAATFDDPKSKLIKAPEKQLIADRLEDFDKVYLVYLDTSANRRMVSVIEIDVLMRFFGPVRNAPLGAGTLSASPVTAAILDAFSPVVRIENAGQKNADGIVRAAGLVTDRKRSSLLIRAGDALVPMVRKNDRNGDPFQIGPIDWAYLICEESQGSYTKMDYYSGRGGGLQGRKNNRTFRTALRVKPASNETEIRLHSQGRPDFPLISYEIYERELDSKSMTFVGRTNWDGRLVVHQTDQPMRLFYVKNGGAVLARLPTVPGLLPNAVADLRGDDLRLQAEAYIRGVQNSIIDLVAVRELFKARIMMKLREGNMEEAEDLLQSLKDQPNNEALAGDMGQRQAELIKAVDSSNNRGQSRKIDDMFKTTRDLLSKHISPKIIEELDAAARRARQNGGKLPPEPKEK
ncbi:MAG: hypothetical protein AAF664_02960 [Planctomycetota bacterium]